MALSLEPRPGLALLKPHFQRQLLGFFWGFWLLAFATMTSAAIPYVMKLATDALSHDSQATRQYALLLVGVALINALLRVRSRTHVYRLGRQVEHSLRQDYHDHLMWMDAEFFERSSTGDLVSRGTNDILAIRMFIGPGFLQLSNTVMAYAVALPVMVGMDPWLTLIALSPYPVVLILAWLLTKRLYQLSRLVADGFGKLTSFIQESLSGMAVIRNHNQEKNWDQHFQKRLDLLYHSHANHTNLQSVFGPLMIFTGALSGLIILSYGGHKVVQGVLTLGDFVAFSGYLAMLIWPTIGFGWILTIMQRGLAALDRLNHVLATPTTTREPMETSAPPWTGQVTIHRLNFSFPGTDKPVLHEISLAIPPGSFVGLVGRVGCGKSALLQCLARLYPVATGTIFFDGRDINQVTEGALRANVAMAPQESFLFSATVLDNLLYGQHLQNESAAWHWAEQVSLTNEIAQFPQQMQTLVGERGITLSGGQRQRVALARALAMASPILLLDDIFSSVDARTEEAILEKLFKPVADQPHPTVVMVCHRVAALHRADIVFVMEEGRIVAQGGHHHLLAESSLYQELHHRMERAEALESLQ